MNEPAGGSTENYQPVHRFGLYRDARGKGTMKKLFLIGAALLFASSCVRTIPTANVAHIIIEGKTTKAEVAARFGRPDMKYTTPGMKITSGTKAITVHQPAETWLYFKSIFEVLDLAEETYLKINFSKDGIVTSYGIVHEE